MTTRIGVGMHQDSTILVPVVTGASIELSDSSSTDEKEPIVADGIYIDRLNASDAEALTACAMVASAIPTSPPKSWFANPMLPGPTPLTVSDNGRVFGHIAAWHVDHIGLPFGTRPPKSKSNYAYFHTGVCRTEEGDDVPVGQLTLAGGHAALELSANEAIRHYDDTASAVADVHAGEDAFGIYVSGALRPGTTPEQIRILRASAPSGDWRPIQGRLELVAVCQVNVPGFPVARARVASGYVTALVAAGASAIAELRGETVDERLAKIEREQARNRVKENAAMVAARFHRSVELGSVEMTEFRNYSKEKRDEFAKKGWALPDGCLSADTEFITPAGNRRIGDSVGHVTVLTDKGWVDAEVQSFGYKRLVEVVFSGPGGTQTVMATEGHRWMLSDGSWVLTDRLAAGMEVPHVVEEPFNTNAVQMAQSGVASDAHETAHTSRTVAVVNMESSPLLTSTRSTTLARNLSADGTLPSLCHAHAHELFVGDPVFPDQCGIAATYPALVTGFDLCTTDSGLRRHTGTALGTATLPSAIELGMGLLDLTDPALDKALVLNGSSAGLSGRRRGTSSVEVVVPSAKATGSDRSFTIGDGADVHADHSLTWRVLSVNVTERIEEVFCAVVPDLYRFALASGILTGNSYPIKDVGDLRRAIRAYGRSSKADRAKVRQHIMRRARGLNRPDLIPDTWMKSASVITRMELSREAPNIEYIEEFIALTASLSFRRREWEEELHPRDAHGKFRKVLFRIKEDLETKTGTKAAIRDAEDAIRADEEGDDSTAREKAQHLIEELDKIAANTTDLQDQKDLRDKGATLGEVMAYLPMAQGDPSVKMRYTDLPVVLRELVEDLLTRVEKAVSPETYNEVTGTLRSYMSGNDFMTSDEVQAELSRLMRFLI